MKKISKTIKIGAKNKFSYWVTPSGELFNNQEIISSWKKSYNEKISRSNDDVGLRAPQYGALSAIRAHWVVSNEPATIILPTGTGKTETMFATIVSELIKKTLIIVPSDLLREQFFKSAQTFGILPDIGIINEDVIFPNVFLYKSKIENEKVLNQTFKDANIIVSTPGMINKLPTNTLTKLINEVDVVIFDEAHHLAANQWHGVKSKFSTKKILQFTATPFREDGIKIGGKIIFNYSLSLAQEANYFQQIDFYPIHEYSELKSDSEIAKEAIKHLKNDLERFDHVVLARAKSKQRANELYEKIYSQYDEFKPVVIHSDIKLSERKKSLKQVKDGISKIVVCVDMFGEGIDIPELKIAAIHDKYKSLPITLQFIGRFARTNNKKKLGNAKLITNIAKEDLRSTIEELYHQDADWNSLLKTKTDSYIDKELESINFFNKFNKGYIENIDLSQLRMKVSTRIFKTNTKQFIEDQWEKVLDRERTLSLFNKEENVYIFIEEIEKQVPWSEQKDIIQYEYDFFVIFFDEKNGLIHINETDTRKGASLIKYIFPGSNLIKGESIYRCLGDINRLMIGTLGLKQRPSGRISFRMFAGTDIKSGISQSTISGSTKSNLFGHGYRNGSKISIGCSYKGKVWMRWVEKVDFWKEWCLKVGEMILDNSIDTKKILENSLVLESISKFPEATPFKIMFPEHIELLNSSIKKFYFPSENETFDFYQSELRNPNLKNGELHFDLVIIDKKFKFKQVINDESFYFEQISGEKLYVKERNGQQTASEFFKENSPEISFINNKGIVFVVEENLQIELKGKNKINLSDLNLQHVNWLQLGVNIRKESQGKEKVKNSIQYATIHNLVDQDVDIIFDDDGSGETADVVTIKMDDSSKEVNIELFHCKYSSGDVPGGRLSDMYEVCGQAQKSIIWHDNSIEFINRLIVRENKRQNANLTSRLEKGSLNDLYSTKQRIISGFNTKFTISIVQPGVSINKITDQMKQLLLATETHLKETYELPLNLYFSK